MHYFSKISFLSFLNFRSFAGKPRYRKRPKYYLEIKPSFPNPFGPAWLWRKCLNFQSLPRYLSVDNFSKYLRLTQTIHLDFDFLNKTQFSDSTQTVSLQLFSKLNYLYHRYINSYFLSFEKFIVEEYLPNIFLTVKSLKEEYAHVFDCSFAKEIDIEAFWMRKSFKFFSKMTISYCFHSKFPHSSSFFCSDNFGNFQSDYNNCEFGFFQTSLQILNPHCGFRSDQRYVYPYSHTIFGYYEDALSSDLLKCYGLSLLYTHAISYFQQWNIHNNNSLSFPNEFQGIFFNQTHVFILKLQLNDYSMNKFPNKTNFVFSSNYIPIASISNPTHLKLNTFCIMEIMRTLLVIPNHNLCGSAYFENISIDKTLAVNKIFRKQ